MFFVLCFLFSCVMQRFLLIILIDMFNIVDCYNFLITILGVFGFIILFYDLEFMCLWFRVW